MATKAPDWLDPYSPDLDKDQARLAIADLVSDRIAVTEQGYSKKVRSQRDIPIAQQTYGLLSWMLFDEPKKTRDGKSVYGFLKLRGNYSDVDLCKNRAGDIIRTQDSMNKVIIVPTGAWVPITDNDLLTKETVNIELNDDSLGQIREAAVKEREKEQARIMREIKERIEEVVDSADYNDDENHLDYYSMKMTTWLQLNEERVRRIKMLDEVNEKIVAARNKLAKLDALHPEHEKNWVAHYNQARLKVGISAYVPSKEVIDDYHRTAPEEDL